MKVDVLPVEKLAVSANEAAKLLDISRPTLYTLLNRSDFPSFRIGNRILVNVSALKDWVNRQTQERSENA